MACDVDELLEDVGCFSCKTDNQLLIIMSALLCRIYTATGSAPTTDLLSEPWQGIETTIALTGVDQLMSAASIPFRKMLIRANSANDVNGFTFGPTISTQYEFLTPGGTYLIENASGTNDNINHWYVKGITGDKVDIWYQ